MQNLSLAVRDNLQVSFIEQNSDKAIGFARSLEGAYPKRTYKGNPRAPPM